LISGRIESSSDRVEFTADALSTSLPLAEPVRTGPAILGIRPQSLTGVPSGERPSRGIALGTAGVLSVEHHGPESFATCRLHARTITVEIAPASGLGIGDEISIAADLSDLHLFDPGTGRRLMAN
jgi:ABC-type sugar transport system ATPase subunit